jgi:AraC-like DNA-binding protein
MSPTTVADQDSNWVLKLLAEIGVDLQQLGQSHPAEFAALAMNPVEVPMEATLVILNAAAEQTGDDNLGLHMARRIDLRNMGTYGYLLRNAPTVGEFLSFSARYYNIMFRAAQFHFRRLGRRCRLEYRLLTPTTQSQRHDIEWALGAFAHFLRQRIGPGWYPDSVCFTHSAPADTGELHALFGRRIAFAQRTNALELDSTLLDHPIHDGDPELLKVLKVYADNLVSDLKGSDALYHRVRLLTIQGFKEEGFNLPVLASRLGMSESTLRRRLAEYQLNFRTIREEIIEALARQYLTETSLPIGTIALELGYSEAAAFNHAFRRMTGQSPRVCRRRQAA